MAPRSQGGRPLAVTSPLPPDTLLLDGFSGAEGVNQLYCYVLDMLAEQNAAIDFAKVVGQRMTVTLGPKKAVYGGIVRRFVEGGPEKLADGATLRRYHAELVPEAWLLTLRSQSRVFQNLPAPDILKQVFAGQNAAWQLAGQYPSRNYCVQYRESDFAFASRLMEEEGIFYFFKHSPSGTQMIFADNKGAFPDLAGGKVPVDFGGGDEKVRRWEKSQQIRSAKVTLRDHCFELPSQNLEAQKPVQDTVTAGGVAHSLNVGNNGLERYDFPGGYAKHFDGINSGGGDSPADLQKIFQENSRLAGLRAQEEAAQAITIDADATCTNLASGCKFTLDTPDAKAAGDYLVVRVEHGMRMPLGKPGVKAEVSVRFQAAPVDVLPRPRRITPRPSCGPQTARVVGPAGEEIFTDKYGRVKVQFFWDRQGQSDANSSCWIRVSQMLASKQLGAVSLPHAGDEVVVDFLEGDPDQPIIVGRVYNAENMPPLALPANKAVDCVVAKQALKLQVGSAHLILNQDGTVSLTGTDVQVH